MHRNINDPRNWLLLPPGTAAICRFPAMVIPPDCRKATAAELLVANQGRPYPWGDLPESTAASHLWKQHRIGIGGLYHDKWFITADGRFGGAPNVAETQPDALRYLMYTGDIGPGESDYVSLQDNEGYALVRPVAAEDTAMYHRVMLHVGRRVAADRGNIIVSSIGPDTTVYVGFVGRCQFCSKPEDISIDSLRNAVPGYRFELLPEWQNWH